jgi:hypothetical protein
MTSPFVPTYRQFPTDDARNLERQLTNFHLQTNTAVNQRTIGNFELYSPPVAAPSNAPAPSIPDGERWFPATGQTRLRDGHRLVVQVSDSVLTVIHNITVINLVTRLYGTFFDGTLWQTLPYVDVVAAANQIKLSVSSTQIIVTKGAGAPSISSGVVVLEFV